MNNSDNLTRASSKKRKSNSKDLPQSDNTSKKNKSTMNASASSAALSSSLMMNQALIDMQAEMEIAGLPNSLLQSNQKRRIVPKTVARARTDKIRALNSSVDEECRPLTEQEEVMGFLNNKLSAAKDHDDVSSDVLSRVRIRGRGGNLMSRMMKDDGGLFLMDKPLESGEKDKIYDSDENEESDDEYVGSDVDDEDDNNDNDDEELEDEDDDEGGEGDDENDEAGTEKIHNIQQNSTIAVAKKRAPKRGLRNRGTNQRFKARYLAERHGRALGAYACGNQVEAVQQLHEVSTFAPTAPQIYSSLGLLYESIANEKDTSIDVLGEIDNETYFKNITAYLDGKQDGSLVAQVKLLEKAYGAYHVSACLNRRNFTLWARAGDVAKRIADMYDHAMILARDDEEKLKSFRTEKKRWIKHACGLYQDADKLCPSGVDIPAKLAAAHFELNELAEALNILTDLKQKDHVYILEHKGDKQRQRTALEQSYSVWLIYADLMLRIGYECLRYNRNEPIASANKQKWFYQRFLKAYSKTFDWQEKRLQALCLCLEAAAGSECCYSLMRWIKRRMISREQNKCNSASNELLTEEDEDKMREISLDCHLTVNDVPDNRNDTILTEIQVVETLKSNLIQEHKFVLSEFDKATELLGHEKGSSAALEREMARKKLVHDQRQHIISLVADIHMKQKSLHSTQDESSVMPLLPTASCATVITIVSKLMKLCVKMNEYEGGCVAAEVLSSYMRARVKRYELRKERIELRNKLHEEKKQFDLQQMVNDEIREESDNSDSELYISDDEDFEKDGEEFKMNIVNMRNGYLPAEIRVLYGCCLVGFGKNDFAAMKLFKSFGQLENEEYETLSKTMLDLNIVPDDAWYLFSHSENEPLQKSSAIIFVDSMLRSLPDDLHIKWSMKLLPYIASHFQELIIKEKLDFLQGTELSANLHGMFYYDRLSRVVLAYCYHLITFAENYNTYKVDFLESDIELLRSSPIDIATSIMDVLMMNKMALWSFQNDRSLGGHSVEVLKLLLRVFNVVMNTIELHSDMRLISTFMRMKKLMECMFGIKWFSSFDPGSFIINEPLSAHISRYPPTSWNSFPISDRWQTEDQHKISLLVFNLCVSCNVTRFVGWKADAFTLSRLGRIAGNYDTFIGVNSEGNRIIGRLHGNTVDTISTCWIAIKDLVPSLPAVPFGTLVSEQLESEWVKEKMLESKTKYKSEVIASSGEIQALDCLSLFAFLCLTISEKMSSIESKYSLLLDAFSIILPMTQFCTNDPFWTSVIGTGGETYESVSQDFPVPSLVVTNGQQEKSKVNTDLNPASKSFSSEMNANNHSNLDLNRSINLTYDEGIPISTSDLLKEWKKVPNNISVTSSSKDAMNKLDTKLKDLRKTTSINTAKQLSIDVASCLLDVAATPHCFNPIDCLKRSLTFIAHHSTHKDNKAFRKPLPDENLCTSTEALVVLGRADCMRALLCYSEAVYLCEFVARVCRSRRIHCLWDARWRVVSIYLQIVVRNINVASKEILEWCPHALEEIARGKQDAKSFSPIGQHDNSATSGLDVEDNHHHSRNASHILESSVEAKVDVIAL